MTALKASEIDKFIARPDPARPIVLVYGADAGLVRERAEALLRASVDDPNDPFSLARIESEQLAANPARLAEEANTVPLFGGRRVVMVKVNSRHNIAGAVETLLADPPKDCRVIIEAGELRKTAPLRAACEKSKAAAAIACYPDRAADIGRLIDDEMREAGLTLTGDARAMLATLLGGDRLASRSELRKLVLYAQGKERVDIDDVRAVISDASELALDGVVDAAFAGKTADVEREFTRIRNEGSTPVTIVMAALRHVSFLHKLRLAMAEGSSPQAAMASTFPRVHFSREDSVEAALRAWTPARLERAMAQLAEANLETRRQPALADAIAQRSLLSLALAARRREA